MKETVKKTIEQIGAKHLTQSEQKYSATCKVCGKKFEYNPHEMEKRWETPDYCSVECEEKAREKARQKKIINNINGVIPPRYRNIDFDAKTTDNLLSQSVFITGDVGTGKTTLMATLIKRYITQGKLATWISFTAFIMRLQNMFNDKSKSPYELAEEIARTEGILAIDDLGSNKLTDFVKQITYYIINEREQRELPIIITSNFSLSKIDEMIDPRISSRIAGMCRIFKLSGKDKRLGSKTFEFKEPAAYLGQRIYDPKSRSDIRYI